MLSRRQKAAAVVLLVAIGVGVVIARSQLAGTQVGTNGGSDSSTKVSWLNPKVLQPPHNPSEWG